MRPLRYFYVLALVLWLGGMSIAGLVVAPTTFGVLEGWNPAMGRVLAGEVFGAVLARLHLIAYLAGAIMCATLTIQRLLGPRPRSYGIRMALVALMLVLSAYSGMVLAPQISEVQAGIAGPMTELAADDPRRLRFDSLHGLSTGLVTATIVGGLVLLGWETKE